jgi:8-oxo-dGTP diphosphatase
MNKPRIDVAVAVVFNPHGEVLWGCRPVGKPYAGYWEFPGGKVEPNETVWQALVRELQEELGIVATQGGPWFLIEHDYEHANVRLHLYKVWGFEGEPQSLEQQAFQWAALHPTELSPILPATEPLLPKLAQPRLMAVSNYEDGFEACANRLTVALAKQASPMYVQFREKRLHGEELWRAFEHCRSLCRQHGHRFLLNSSSHVNMGPKADGLDVPLHLTQAHLQSGIFQARHCAGASVHDASALRKAFESGLDYAVLGAVKPTPTHPGQSSLGWGGFAQLASAARLPVFAIGGLSVDDLDESARHGAHGVAMIRQFR